MAPVLWGWCLMPHDSKQFPHILASFASKSKRFPSSLGFRITYPSVISFNSQISSLVKRLVICALLIKKKMRFRGEIKPSQNSWQSLLNFLLCHFLPLVAQNINNPFTLNPSFHVCLMEKQLYPLQGCFGAFYANEKQCWAHSHRVVNMSCFSILLAARLGEGGTDGLGRKSASGGLAVCITL